MQVLIMRHGDAVPDTIKDAERPLTLSGRGESLQVASWLNKQSVNIEQILVSPYLRAKQTLEVTREALVLPREQEVMPELTPSGDVVLMTCYLQTLAKEGCSAVLLISHLPLVGYLVAELCPGHYPPMFATSAIACVSLDESTGHGILDWQARPSHTDSKNMISSVFSDTNIVVRKMHA
ncbi:phosphohistidine phosphatase SixA [Candidatus Fukatsuia endosymbiont of Tuberolachnus salignus]|uniref:phosphohistidine phosphatase SixA n=1 Tax=Candidatus Fukatsuia endosymbiont of Tuberolachnus salignus TaxID=3077957 RepID=UPI00313C96D1